MTYDIDMASLLLLYICLTQGKGGDTWISILFLQ